MKCFVSGFVSAMTLILQCEPARTVRYKAAEVPAHNTMPCSTFALVELE